MAFNQATITGKWLEIKGEIQKAWGKLSSDELEQTKGDLKSIAGLIKQKYGEEKEHFEKKFSEIMKPYHDQKEGAVEDIKNKLKS